MALSGAHRRLLLVSTNYAPEHAGIGPYATQIAEHWAAGGSEVHVLTGMPHYPAWRLDPAYAGVRRVVEERGGVRVHRRSHTVPPRQTAVKRALYEASVLRGALSAPPEMERPDAVVAQMPSLAGGVAGARLAGRYGVPFVPVVQDLMGAAAAQSGIRGGGAAAVAARAVESYALKRAALVGVIHDTFVPKVAAMGVPERRIRLVPNWSHVQRPSRPRAEMRARLGWRPGQTVLLHSGNMGLKQGLEVLVDVARLAPELRVVLMGDGNQREQLRSLAGGLPNLDFMAPADDADFADVLAAADVLAVTQRGSVLDMSLPSKLTSYFAAGRPVVAAVAADSGTALEIARSGAGVVAPPEDAGGLLATVRALVADPARVEALALRGPVYADAHLSRAAGLARLDALLAEALGTTPPRPTTPPLPPARPEPGPHSAWRPSAEPDPSTSVGAPPGATGNTAPPPATASEDTDAAASPAAKAVPPQPVGAPEPAASAGAQPSSGGGELAIADGDLAAQIPSAAPAEDDLAAPAAVPASGGTSGPAPGTDVGGESNSPTGAGAQPAAAEVTEPGAGAEARSGAVARAAQDRAEAARGGEAMTKGGVGK